MDERSTVYIDGLYDDEWDESQPWSRRRRDVGERPWIATTGGTTDVDEEAEFDTADEAIAWGRERAGLVLVRLGYSAEAMYSAGEHAAAWFLDGSGWRFPLWPPVSWPEYTGPPEPGWPKFEPPNDED